LRLATGKRINQASDDPAGLTIALKMKVRNEGLKTALGNIGDAKNMLSVAESGLQQMNDILTEMKAKATAAASDTLGTDERTAIQNQLKSLAQQINDIVDETSWNSEKLLDGDSVGKTLQTGAGGTDTTEWKLEQVHYAQQLGVATGSATSAAFATTSTSTGTSFNTITSTTDLQGLQGVSSFDGVAEAESGTYKFRVADKATSTAVGAVIQQNSTSTTFTGVAATAAYELSSGQYALTIDAVSGGTIDYTIADSLGNVVATYDGLGAGAGADILDTDGHKLGLTLDSTGLSASDELNFEYIGAGEVKMELYEVSGSSETLVAVDANGTDDTGVDTKRSVFYLDASSSTAANRSYDTGLGFKVYTKAFATVNEGDNLEFEFTTANDVIVDVSTAAQASTYMTNLDTAITTVSNSLNGIGSLVARLDAKEQSVSAAQVNTESAYNRIMNADMAYEQVEASRYQILQQTAVAMLAQSNMAPQGILSLFR